MRNKLINTNQTNSISKGGVLYRPGEIPTLNKEQIAQANLVNKLPGNFPFASWESMNTRQQLQTIRTSGLNDQEQWSLLNTNVPLVTLNQFNQAQNQSESTAYVARAAANLVNTTSKAAVTPTQATAKSPSNSTSLQTTAQQRKLDMQQEEYETRFYEKAAGRTGILNPPNNTLKTPVATKPVKSDQQPVGSEGDSGKKETLFDKFFDWVSSKFPKEEKPEPTPQIVPITTAEPSPTKRMTPTPVPVTTPKPTPSESELRAQAVVDKGKALADEGVKYTWGGKQKEDGLDCSGLVVLISQGTNLKFGQGYLSYGAEGMVKSFKEHPEFGTAVYDYSKDSQIPTLQVGDLVFSAKADNLSENKHVMMATGNGLQVVEASSVTGVNKVTYQFDAYRTQKNGKYYRDSGQVVTYVIRPKY